MISVHILPVELAMARETARGVEDFAAQTMPQIVFLSNTPGGAAYASIVG